MALFTNKNNLGLDIGSAFIKVCLPHKSGRPIVLRLPTPPALVSKGVLQQSDQGVEHIKIWVRKHNLDNYPVVATLPASTLVLRHIQIPMLKTKETGEAVEWEARRVLPFALEEAQVDWLRQGTIVSEEGEMQEILLVAVRDNIVDRYVQVIREAGMKLVALDIAPMALGRWILKQALGSSLIIDIGADTTQLHFFEGQKLVFSRSLGNGGMQSTQSIASVLGVSFEEAEIKKLRGEYKEEWLSSWHRELSRELHRSLEYFRNTFTQYAQDGFQRVILSGGASLTRGIVALVREVTAVEPGFAEFSSRERTARHDKIMYNVALGAGLWEG